MKDSRPQSKTCPKCKTEKTKDLFNKSLTRLDRMAVYCKACEKANKDKKNLEKKANEMYGII